MDSQTVEVFTKYQVGESKGGVKGREEEGSRRRNMKEGERGRRKQKEEHERGEGGSRKGSHL